MKCYTCWDLGKRIRGSENVRMPNIMSHPGSGGPKPPCLFGTNSHEHCETWWRIGRAEAFRQKGRGFESRSSHHVGTLGKSFDHSQLPVALRRETPAQYPCCIGSAEY